MIDIKEQRHERYVSLRPSGDLDAHSAMELDMRIRSLLDEGVINLHIDGSDIRYISSAGMGVFISFLDEIQAKGGRMVFSSLAPNVLDVFELLGLSQIFTIYPQHGPVAELFAS